jgi:hypothetical protein
MFEDVGKPCNRSMVGVSGEPASLKKMFQSPTRVDLWWTAEEAFSLKPVIAICCVLYVVQPGGRVLKEGGEEVIRNAVL